MGLFGGTQVKTNMAEFSVKSHGVDCSGDRKVLTVVYPNWPLFHGSLIKNWGKLDPLFCV